MTKKSILVVDDDACIRLACTKVFANTDFKLQAAESAEEALEIMRATPAEILFLDLNLPGMSGLELCQEIHRNWPRSILIAITGYASVFELVKCREVGFDDYFIKPLGKKELLMAANDALQKLDRWKQRQEAFRSSAGPAKR
jgi:DNA-binding response OmpR family regulator